MKIIQRALKGSLVATGLGLVFMSGAYVGCKTLGKSIERMYPEEYTHLKHHSKVFRTSPFMPNWVRDDADFIYQSLK